MGPFLERTLDLSREYSAFFAPYQHVIDPQIDDVDEGMTCASVRALLNRAQPRPPSAGAGDLRSARGPRLQPAAAFAKEASSTSLGICRPPGYDLNRGRLDRTHHPFCTRFSAGDVRITTRVSQTIWPTRCSRRCTRPATRCTSRHQRRARRHAARTGVSAGVHESQSRLWENVVARSHGFWEHFYPPLQRPFRSSWQACRLRLSIAPSIRSRGR